MAVMMKTQLTIAPILFHWSAEQKLDFYARIADEAPVDVVYLGEVICSKRTPFFEKHYDEVAERLTRAGKTVVFSTLAEVMLKRERNMIAGFCNLEDYELEINDSSALWHLDDKPYRVGSLMNVYNEDTMAYLVAKGATHFSLPAELPRDSVAILAARAKELGVTTEVQVFGRVSLALSARCYHARAHGRIKDNCQFVCEEDMDGMPLNTLDKEEFLTVNGIQTLSHSYLNLLDDLDDMKEMGITHFRLVPHTQDMVAVANIFRDALDNTVSTQEASINLAALDIPAPFSNGFWYGQPGHQFVTV
jgi:collagenase-like PrtC family protease